MGSRPARCSSRGWRVSVIGNRGSVHVTTPGLPAGRGQRAGRLCDYVTLNSSVAVAPVRGRARRPGSSRVCASTRNSQLVDDARYDPCRRHSKLGVPLDQLQEQWRRRPDFFDGVGGLHFHTNCDSSSFEPLHRTVLHLDDRLGDLLSRLSWINLGGGYLFDPARRPSSSPKRSGFCRSRHGWIGLPSSRGRRSCRKAGCLVASVIDMFRSDGKSIAVLDTTVNHMPEVFEYQFEPDVLGHDDDAEHEYLLAGSSCLAGDLMGDYAFRRPLRIGSRVVLTNVGAYAMVKAHMFNGINLPTIYSVTTAGELVLRRRFTYDDFVSRFGVCRDAAV